VSLPAPPAPFQTDPESLPRNGSAVLEVRGLSKHYGDQVALGGIDFEVLQGQIFGLLGPNGSGKTTTLNCALGLLHPTSGSVRILGQPSQHIYETRGRVAVVFDKPVLLPSHTISQNLKYGERLRNQTVGRKASEVLKLVGLVGLEDRKAGQLSLGQMRRLSIALALAGNPELLVLDEPLAGLDPIGVREIMALLARLRDEGLTLLVSSHRLFEMERLLTHAGVLIQGKLAAIGSLEELLGAAGRIRAEVDAPERALELAHQNSWKVLAQRGQELTLDSGAPAEEVNQALVQAGIGVKRLTPARSSLPDLFEQLVDAQEQEQ